MSTTYLKSAGIDEVRQWHGTYHARIVNINDPQSKGRAVLRIPQVLGTAESNWAVPALPISTPPPIGATVTASFLGGDINRPVYYLYPGAQANFSINSLAATTATVGTANVTNATVTNATVTNLTIPSLTVPSLSTGAFRFTNSPVSGYYLTCSDSGGDAAWTQLPAYPTFSSTNANFKPDMPSGVAGVNTTGARSDHSHPFSFQVAYKTSTTGRASTTTPTNDPDLQVTLTANDVYEIRATIFYDGGTGASEGDIQVQWAMPAGINGAWSCAHINISGSYVGHTALFWNNTVTAQTSGVSNALVMVITGWATVTSTGTMAMQWAQNTSTTTNTHVEQYSYLIAQRIA